MAISVRNLLGRVKAQLTHYGLEPSGIFLPDLYTFLDIALNQLVARNWHRETRKEIFLNNFSIILTGNPEANHYTGSLTTAKDSGLRQEPPFRQVSLGGDTFVLYTPLVDVNQLDLSDSFYSTQGDTLHCFTAQPVTIGTTAVVITAYQYPTVTAGNINVPRELESDLVTLMVNLIAEKRQQGARKQ